MLHDVKNNIFYSKDNFKYPFFLNNPVIIQLENEKRKQDITLILILRAPCI